MAIRTSSGWSTMTTVSGSAAVGRSLTFIGIPTTSLSFAFASLELKNHRRFFDPSKIRIRWNRELNTAITCDPDEAYNQAIDDCLSKIKVMQKLSNYDFRFELEEELKSLKLKKWQRIIPHSRNSWGAHKNSPTKTRSRRSLISSINARRMSDCWDHCYGGGGARCNRRGI